MQSERLLLRLGVCFAFFPPKIPISVTSVYDGIFIPNTVIPFCQVPPEPLMLPDVAHFTNVLHYFNDNYWVKINLFQQTTVPDLTVFINRIHAFHYSRWANICFFTRLWML